MGTMYYWDDDHGSSGKGYTLRDAHLLGDFKKAFGNKDEEFIRVRVYWTPLTIYQRDHDRFYHAFVLLETDLAYYTVEVSERCHTLARSTDKTDIRDYYPGGR
ncbi:unnamed protein product, partial [Rotaria magnacalcarata]